MCPPRVPEHGNKTLGWRKVYEASIQWQKSTNNPSQPASLSLAPLSLRLPPRHPTGRWGFSGEHDTARLQVTDMSHHLKPCGTIIPLSLWRQKGRGGGGSVVGNGGSRGEKGDGGYRARVSEWEEKWRVCGLGGAGGCFTPGLFKETAQGMPLVLLTKHFFFSFFFSLSIAGCAPVESSGPPVFPLSHLRMPQKVFLADIGPVSVLMFQMNIAMLLRPCRGVTWGVRIDAGLMSNLQLRDCHSTRVVLHSGDSLLQPL